MLGLVSVLSFLTCVQSAGLWTLLAQYDFTHGGTIQTTGTNPNFTFFAAGPFVGNGGTQTSKPRYDEINSSPFTLTASPSAGGDPLDHVKFLAVTSQAFNITRGTAVSCHTTLRTYQTIPHTPFGTLVEDPASDPRIAAGTLTTIGNTYTTADIWVTNTTIYALYERLPFLRTATDVYASFTHLIPIATRTPGHFNSLTVTYAYGTDGNKSITWSVDGIPLYTVNKVGYLIPGREFLVRDEGGVGEDAFPASVQCAVGTFNLLDAYPPCTNPSVLLGAPCVRASSAFEALVDLSNGTSPLYKPDVAPNRTEGGVPATFFDPQSLQSNRLFGEGAIVDVKYLIVFETDLSYLSSFLSALQILLQLLIAFFSAFFEN